MRIDIQSTLEFISYVAMVTRNRGCELDGLLEVLSPGVVVGEFESARRGGVLHFLQLLATHEPSLQKTNLIVPMFKFRLL